MREHQWSDARDAYEKAYLLGRYNYLSALRGLLESSIQGNQTAALTSRLPQFEKVLTAYADAIARNSHFIALTGNVEEVAQVAALLAVLSPANAQTYRLLSAQTLAHAQEERARAIAKHPGYLW